MSEGAGQLLEGQLRSLAPTRKWADLKGLQMAASPTLMTLMHLGQDDGMQVLQIRCNDFVATIPSTCPSLLPRTGKVPLLGADTCTLQVLQEDQLPVVCLDWGKQSGVSGRLVYRAACGLAAASLASCHGSASGRDQAGAPGCWSTGNWLPVVTAHAAGRASDATRRPLTAGLQACVWSTSTVLLH